MPTPACRCFGGSGFTQDWPIEQFVRDGRIARIYEGTNGIQAMDLVGRKLGLHKGRLVQSLFGDMTTYLKANPDCAHRDAFKGALGTLEEAINWLNDNGRQDPNRPAPPPPLPAADRVHRDGLSLGAHGRCGAGSAGQR